jgi:uncharacterized protein (DUF697 family)
MKAILMGAITTDQFLQRVGFMLTALGAAFVLAALTGAGPLLPAATAAAFGIALAADLHFGAAPCFEKQAMEFAGYSALAHVVMAIEKVF